METKEINASIEEKFPSLGITLEEESPDTYLLSRDGYNKKYRIYKKEILGNEEKMILMACKELAYRNADGKINFDPFSKQKVENVV